MNVSEASSDTDNNVIIQFIGLGKSYGQRQIFSDVDFDFCDAQSRLLIGKNGSGKSTLLRVMSGLLKPDCGKVKIRKQLGGQVGSEANSQGKESDYSWAKQHQNLRSHVMYMHQAPYLFDGTVIKNLGYALTNEPDQAARRLKIQEALRWSGLELVADSPAKQLSGGEKQRLALARARLRNSRILFLDEPTANLDQSSSVKTIELLSSLKKSGVSLIIACHEYQEFLSISDGILQLNNGTLQNF